VLADGDLLQSGRGSQVTTRLVFRFKDGSLHDETTVFSQQQQFRLISDHLVQKGPSFPRSLEMTVDGRTGDATVRYADASGKPHVETKQFDLPPDLANGLLITMLKNVRPAAPPGALSFLVATPSPRLVKLGVSVARADSFSTGRRPRTATHYVLKVNIGGLAGLLAPLLHKQPPDFHVWILGGTAPAFVKAEQPLYAGGPVWRIELLNPTWPSSKPTNSGRAATQ
jgi:hypothetical protein